MKKIMLFLLLPLAIACQPKLEKPDPFLSEKTFTNLLVDIHLVEGELQVMQSKNYNLDSTKVYTAVAYNKVFEKYKIKSSDFEANLYYYTYHCRQLDAIYKEVQKRLDEKSAQLSATPEKAENIVTQ